MRLLRSIIRFAVIIAVAAMLVHPADASQVGYVVKVNGDPITSYDVSQRQKLLALTQGTLGKRMRALLESEDTKRKFQEFVRQQQPKSRAEAQALQKQFVDQLQAKVMRDIQSETRDTALQELIDERLMLQEAQRQEVSVSEAEVNEQLRQMASSNDSNQSLDEFLSVFQKRGVDPETMRQRIRAQLVWRNVIRKLYSFRIASLVGADSSPNASAAATTRQSTFTVRRVRIAAAAGDRALARAYVRGQTIRKQFSSCGGLAELAKRAGNAEVESYSGKKAEFFPRDARPLLMKASAGEMLPPVVSGQAVDLYAVCGKKTPEAENQTGNASTGQPDRRQEEFKIYARRHLMDLRQDALIERR